MNKKVLEYFKNDELAASVWWGKYRNAQLEDKTPNDMHLRMAKEFARIDEKHQLRENKKSNFDKLSNYGKTRKQLSFQRIYLMFKDFKYIIPQGSIMQNLGTNIIGSLSNCFVAGQPYDSYGGIAKLDEEIAQYMKRRGGVGIDLSTLRPNNTKVNNVAITSTGAVSFIHRFSHTTREVAQFGRRGALMVSLDIRHPDILEFIKVKRDLTKVTGANISIKLNDDFMDAWKNNKDYFLRFPINCSLKALDKEYLKNLPYDTLIKINTNDKDNPIYVKKIDAKEYWKAIIKSAHNVAEPGLMFWDRMTHYSPDGVYKKYQPITTNPCSEIAMQPYDACRLIAMNLLSFVNNPFTNNATFDLKKFYFYNYEAMRLSDDLIDLEAESIDRILKKIELDNEPWEIKKREYDLWKKTKQTALNSRRTGLGFTALGDTLAALNIKYDSNEALEIIEKIMHVKMASELDCTIDLAILRKPFKGWDFRKEYSNLSKDTNAYKGKNDWYTFIKESFPNQWKRMVKYGRRNISFSTVAPTGSLSLLIGSTSGIEPLFMPFYIRRKKINPDNKNAKPDFIDDNGDAWQEYLVIHRKFKHWIMKNDSLFKEIDFHNITSEELNKLFEASPWYKSTANDIDWERRVEIQALIQKYITHSISSTINLPNNVSEEVVASIYMNAWKKGIKGISVYRDGSRSGVLLTSSKYNSPKEESFIYRDSPRRPKELKAIADTIYVAGEHFAIFIGLMNDRVFEIFAYKGWTKQSKGIIKKEGSGNYVFIDETSERKRIVTSKMTKIQRIVTRILSGSFRHGRHPKYIINDITKEGANIFDWITAIKKMLLKYAIKNEDILDKICPNCKEEAIVYEEGCKTCKACGWTACG